MNKWKQARPAPRNERVTLRLSAEGYILLDKLSAHMGLSPALTVEALVKEKAKSARIGIKGDLIERTDALHQPPD